MDRRELYKLMHACMVNESKCQNTDIMLAEVMVNSHPEHNQSRAAHETSGWRRLNVPLYQTRDCETGLKVSWAIYALDTKSDQDEVLLNLEKAIANHLIKTEDHDPDGIDPFRGT